MPHIIPSSNRDAHIADMNCQCEPEIEFVNGKPLILHKDDNDQLPFIVELDDYYDKVKDKPDASPQSGTSY